MSRGVADRATIRRVPFFARLEDSDCEAIAPYLGRVVVTQGSVLFKQGDAADSLFVVHDGTLAATVQRRTGSETPLATVRIGDVVGEMAVLSPACRTCTLTATSVCVLFELKRDDLTKLRVQHPAVFSSVLNALWGEIAARKRRVDSKLDDELYDGASPFAASPSSSRFPTRGHPSSSKAPAAVDTAPPPSGLRARRYSSGSPASSSFAPNDEEPPTSIRRGLAQLLGKIKGGS